VKISVFKVLGAYAWIISISKFFLRASTNSDSFSFSTEQPAANWWPPTSAIDSGLSVLNEMIVFSRTSFRFRPSLPTILAETFILSSL